MMNLLCAPDPNVGVFIGLAIGVVAATVWNMLYVKASYWNSKLIVGMGAIIGAFAAEAIETIVIYFFRLC
jgi:hypothetical protein